MNHPESSPLPIFQIAPASILALVLATAPGSADGAFLFAESFDVDPSANWTVNPSPVTDTATDFFFDYSSVGIPSAPNSAGGSTRGMKLQANLTSGVFGGYSVSPTGLNLAGNFTLAFDLWSNFNGPFPGGGSGSTNLSTYGILTSGTVSNSPGTADGLYFANTGDGGSSADWRIYSPLAPAAHPDGDPFYTDSTRNNTGLTYQVFGGVAATADQLALFPQQTGTTNLGSGGMAWHEVEITRTGDSVTWSVDGVLLATVDTSSMVFGGGNIMFGHSDINATSSTDPNDSSLLFTLIDNVRVIPEPSAAVLLGMAMGVLGLGRRRARR